MAYDDDARLALTTQTLLPANRLVAPIEAVTPLGSRQCSRSETFFWAGFVTTVGQPTFSPLIDRAESEFLGTTPWPTDPTIVIHVSRLRGIHHTRLMWKRGSRCASHAPLVSQPLLPALCPSGVASVASPAAEGEEKL
jgi:hypothetical protein